MTVIKVADVTPLGRGGGVVTIPLITRPTAQEENLITTGISSYPVGKGAPPRSSVRIALSERGSFNST